MFVASLCEIVFHRQVTTYIRATKKNFLTHFSLDVVMKVENLLTMQKILSDERIL